MTSSHTNFQSDNNIELISGGDDHIVTRKIVEHYHNNLKQSPKDLSYLYENGIDKTEAVEKFNLGISHRTLGNLLPEKNRKSGAALRGQLQRIGILKPSGHEVFCGSLVIPIIVNGIVIQMYGRKTSNRLRPGTPIHTYMSDSQQGFFNSEVLQVCEEVIFCSSIFNVLTFWCAGYKNVTCYYGVIPEYNEAAFEILKRSVVKRAIFAFENSDLNNEQVSTLAKKLNGFGVDCYRLELPINMDANTYAIKNSPASESLGELIRKASWIGKGVPSSDKVIEKQEIDEERHANTEVEVVTLDDNVDTPNEDVTQTLPATVLPQIPDDIEYEVNDNEIIINFSERRYRIRGLQNNLTYDQLKVNVLVNKGHVMHVDIVNLYKDSSRRNFIKQVSLELAEKEETIKDDLSKLLLKLEMLQQENIIQTLKPKPKEVEINKKDKTEAMSFLQSPNLLKRILDDFEHCGVVGESTNVLVSYLAVLSRKMDKPLAIIIQSTSAAGKSALMDAVLSFVPEEDKFQYSAMTGQSLFYMGSIDLMHKVLALAEEEGVSKATFPLKIMQSDGRLTISSTGKDPDTGKHVAREYHVEGPVMIFTTTTSIDIDEELLNRCLILTVNEDREQTQAILDYQRFEETLEGLLASQTRDDILRIHHNAQRLLKPVRVINPYAQQLTFLSDKTRTRRDHKKYLTLIRCVTLLHQYQREVKSTYYKGKAISYIEVTLDDIAIANNLAHDILGHSLDDVPPQTQRLLTLIDKMVNEQCQSLHIDRASFKFTRRNVSEYCGWGNTQLKVHLKRLEEMEYLLIHHGGRGKQIVYELLYNSEGKDGKPFVMGLLDVDTLRQKSKHDDNLSGQSDNLSGVSRPQVGKVSSPCRHRKKHFTVNKNKVLDKNHALGDDNAHLENNNHSSSYHNTNYGTSHRGEPL